jgi:hypothetical protein
MKSNFKYLFFITAIVLTQLAFAQKEVDIPDEPEPPEISKHEFDFEFQHYLEMSEKDEKELLKNLKKELQNDLLIIKKVNKERYNDFLRESQYKNMRIPFIAKHEKIVHERERKIFEAEIKAEAIAAQYEKANQSKKQNLKSQLRDELDKLFVQKEERRKQEVEALQRELVELKKSLQARQRNKNQIIERRLQELLEEEEYLEWD